MAVPDLEKIVKIVFSGDDTDLGKTITSVGGGLDTLGKKVGDATQPFADLSNAIITINGVLVGLAGVAFAAAIKSAGDFGDSFNEISTLIEPTSLDIGDFRQNILDYAKDSTQSIEDINSALYNAISAGEDYTTALALLETAEQLGIATKSDLNTAINILRPTLSAFGMDTGSAADFADILFTTVKNGKLTLDELAPVLGNVASIAANAGVPFSDLSAAIAALTATAGISASEAVTQLKAAITAIVAPSLGAQKAAQDLGVALGQEAIEAEGLDGVLKNLVEATGGNIGQLKLLVPRVEALNAVLVLGQDASGIFADALEAMENRLGTAAVAYGKMADNFELVNQRLINNIKAALIDVGEPLLDDWAKLALSLVDILRGVGDEPIDWGDIFAPLIDLAEELLTDLSGYFTDIAEVLPEALENIDWTEFTDAIRDLVNTGKSLFNDLLGGLDLTKPDDLADAIQGVVDTFENWVNLTKGLVEGLAPFIKTVADIIKGFKDFDKDTVEFVGNITGYGASINIIAEAIPKVTGALNLLSGSIGLLSLTKLPGMVAALGAGGLGGALSGLIAVGGPLTLFASAIALIPGTDLNKWLSDNSTAFNTLSTSVNNAYLKMVGIDQKQIDNLKTSGDQKNLLADLAVTVDSWVKSLGDVPEIAETSVQIVDVMALQAEFDLITGKIQKIDDWEDINIEIEAGIKDGSIEKVESDWNVIKTTMEDGSVREIRVDSTKAVEDAREASEKIDKELQNKIIEIKLQGEIDIELERIRTQAETLQTFFEWTAKVEIAEIEAQVEELRIGAELVGIAWQSTGDVISAALGALDADLSGSRWFDVIKIIDREQDIRENLAKQLIKLQEAQIRILDARAAALKKGEGIIQITTDGIEPELEQVLYSIIQKAQVKANEEGFNALLGI